jgi:outer membrane lipoprotein-sorting protein
MKKIIFIMCGAAALITISAAFANNIVNPEGINSMNSNSNSFATVTSNSSGYQRGKVSLSAANLSQPHILKIETPATQLNGKIIVNGKVVKKLKNQKTEIDLSRYLSVGEHKVEISANYSPKMSPIKVELNAPNSNVTQQTSGNGILNYQLEVSVRK